MNQDLQQIVDTASCQNMNGGVYQPLEVYNDDRQYSLPSVCESWAEHIRSDSFPLVPRYGLDGAWFKYEYEALHGIDTFLVAMVLFSEITSSVNVTLISSNMEIFWIYMRNNQ